MVWQLEPAWSLQPAYGGTQQNDCCVPAKAVLSPACGYVPDAFLGSSTRGWGFKAESRLCSLRAVVPHSPLALRFQPFCADQSYGSWVFLLSGQVWPTTGTGAGKKGAYGSTQAAGRTAGEGHGEGCPQTHSCCSQYCSFRGGSVPAPLTLLLAISCRCLQERERTNSLHRKKLLFRRQDKG